MGTEPREPRADAKLKRAPAEQQEELWYLRNPVDADTKALTRMELQLEVPRVCGFTVSAGSLSEWLAWYGLNLRMQAAEERALQAKIKLAQDPDITADELEKISQIVFMAEAMDKKDVDAFAELKKLRQGDKKLEQTDRRLAQNDKRLSQDDRRIAILEAKAARHDAAEGVMKDEELTPEMKQARLKQIFGMG